MEKGNLVAIEYSLFLEDGSKVDSNVDGEPLVYQHGADQILPALEHALSDLDVGQEKRVTLSPDQAYGQVDPQAFQEVPVDAVPEDARREGMLLYYKDDDGQPHRLRVHKVEEEAIVLDLNHPLAGSELTFEVKILDIKPTPDES